MQSQRSAYPLATSTSRTHLQRRQSPHEHVPPQAAEYKVLEEIGRGSFGSVRKVVHLPTDKMLVRKEIRYGHMNSKERHQLISEFSILSQLKHEYIVEFINYDYDSARNVVYLYMEYCSHGDLSQMIKHYKQQKKYIPESIVWRIMAQILMALYRCHYGTDIPPLDSVYDRCKPPHKGKTVVIHRDLKPGNVFLSGDIEDSEQPGRGMDYRKAVVKLGDFGLAKSLGSSVDFATTYVGTPYYMSPEVLMDQPYSPLSDVWSLGCVVYEMCSLHPPFQAKTYMELQDKIKSGDFESIPDYYSQELKLMVESCIDVNLDTRPSTFVLLQDLQMKVMRKSLELERLERNLLDYERELMNIEQILEEQARSYENEMAELKLQYRREFEGAVQQRVREILSGKKVSAATSADILSGRNQLHRPDVHWGGRGR